LGDLLAAVMGDRIARDRSMLPSNAGVTIDVPPPGSSQVEHALRTMTISQAEIELAEASASGAASTANEVHRAETVVLESPPAPAPAVAPASERAAVAVRPPWLAAGAAGVALA